LVTKFHDNGNIVESGTKDHNPNPNPYGNRNFCIKIDYVFTID